MPENVDDCVFEIASPQPAAMIQSMRAIGYDLPTAVADLIDNSIAAGATNVWIDFHWSGANSHVVISDDGCGMSEDELTSAMRLGCRNPLELRGSADLGRFGLGLKTASFSQCRKLSVVSQKENWPMAGRCWDIDYVANSGEWRLLRISRECLPSSFVDRTATLRSSTVILWEQIDRITSSTRVNDDDGHAHFLRQVDLVKNHVAMVFHRFLEEIRPLRIHVNGERVKPWDPFLIDERATQLLTVEAVTLFGDTMNVRPYVLPHYSKTNAEVYETAAGPRGWYSHQGFYVYRNKRLLVAGDWLGLGLYKAEHYKLARIQLDIPNSMDQEWEIDVKKSRATPPAMIRKDLKRLAVLTRNQARDIYRHRGSRLSGLNHELVLLWEKKVHHGCISYAINRSHPLVSSVLEHAGSYLSSIQNLISLIEETVPVPTIIMDGAEEPEHHSKPFQHAPVALQEAMREAHRVLVRSGLGQEEAKIKLINMEPFNHFPELLAIIDDEG